MSEKILIWLDDADKSIVLASVVHPGDGVRAEGGRGLLDLCAVRSWEPMKISVWGWWPGFPGATCVWPVMCHMCVTSHVPHVCDQLCATCVWPIMCVNLTRHTCRQVIKQATREFVSTLGENLPTSHSHECRKILLVDIQWSEQQKKCFKQGVDIIKYQITRMPYLYVKSTANLSETGSCT